MTYSYTKNDRTEVRVEVSEYKGKPLLNLREWWHNGDEDWKPGKGFTIPAENAEAFLQGLTEWAGEQDFSEYAAKKRSKKQDPDEDDAEAEDERQPAVGDNYYSVKLKKTAPLQKGGKRGFFSVRFSSKPFAAADLEWSSKHKAWVRS